LASCYLQIRKRNQATLLTADLILRNASVHTMDPVRPTAEAVAAGQGTILGVGSNDEILRLAGPQTQVIDAARATVLPGFNDAHVHFLAGGFSLSNVDLRAASCHDDLVERLAQFVFSVPAGDWILGGDWDHENWPAAAHAHGVIDRLPTRQLIDPVTSNYPVLITRLDGHMALANTLALNMARIDRQTEDPPGGLIVRDPRTGDPTGILKDAAQALVERIIPPKTFRQKCLAARAASQHAAALGVTSVTDVSTDDDLAVYEALHLHGELKTRIYAARSIVSWETLVHTGAHLSVGPDPLRVGILKGFSDGSLGSSTALFFEPYAGDPANRGLLFDQMLPEGVMLQRVIEADRFGLQVMIHAIGDEANLRILDLFEEVERKNGPRNRRFRIEHAQHLRHLEVARFSRQGVIASMQPYHAADDGRWCEQRLGPERCKDAYRFNSLLRSGALLAFGSDWTVAPLNPLLGIKAAVTRQTLDGRNPGGWNPAERISLDEALYAYTSGSAYAEFSDSVKGSISPGKLADLVVLDRDLYQLDPAEIDRARVRWTILGGKVVYASSE
jgi:predicted amidohydrolase YtcJ